MNSLGFVSEATTTYAYQAIPFATVGTGVGALTGGLSQFFDNNWVWNREVAKSAGVGAVAGGVLGEGMGMMYVSNISNISVAVPFVLSGLTMGVMYMRNTGRPTKQVINGGFIALGVGTALGAAIGLMRR